MAPIDEAQAPQIARPRYGYSRTHRALEVIGITTFIGLSVALGLRVGAYATDLASALVVLSAAAFGYLLADFLSGVAHWLGDRYGRPDTPVLGPSFVRPFREHHIDPKGITRHDFVEVNGNNCLASLPFLVAGLSLPGPERGERWPLFTIAVLLFVCVSGFGTNQFHKWSHMEDPPRLVAWLQRRRLILAPDHHDRHHTPPFETYYCITAGWLNGTLHRLGFWRLLERALTVVGVRPTP